MIVGRLWNHSRFLFLKKMSRYYSYLNSAIAILKQYDGIEPFAAFIKKHFQIGINYTLQQREKTIQEFGVAGIVLGEQKSNYLNHLLKTSLQWNF